MDCDVVIVGAGFAGLSAAVKLADAGLCVVVMEQAPRLGGRATAFTDKTTGERVDNGQHALFGCYRDTYSFLRTIGTADLAPLDPNLELVMADVSGRQSRLSCPPLPAPLHLLAGVLSWGALSWADRLSTLKLAPFLRAVRARGAEVVAAEVPAHLTVSAWLTMLGQGAAVREWLWNPLALAALNQSPDVAGARAFARVLGELFGPERGASALGVPTVPLDALEAEPAARVVEARGGRVLRGGRCEVGGVEGAGKRRRVSFL
ncbi:MAG: NAD(P)-binding protein [Acidobacteria bacterium]|nr:NAD(P)-binding protein [Acidobacteriota bacterium]